MRGTANAGLLPLRQSLESIFIFPSDNEAGATFHLGDVLEVSWTSNYTDPLLWQWCRDPSYGTPYDYIQWAEPVADFNGSVSVPLGPQFGDECWFELFSGDRRKSTLGPRWKFDNNTRNGLPYQSIPSRPAQTTTLQTSTTTTARTTSSRTSRASPWVIPMWTPPPLPTRTSSSKVKSRKDIPLGQIVGPIVAVVVTLFIMGLCCSWCRRERRRIRQQRAPPVRPLDPVTQGRFTPQARSVQAREVTAATMSTTTTTTAAAAVTAAAPETATPATASRPETAYHLRNDDEPLPRYCRTQIPAPQETAMRPLPALPEIDSVGSPRPETPPPVYQR